MLKYKPIILLLAFVALAYGDDIADIRQKYNYINTNIKHFSRENYFPNTIVRTNAEKSPTLELIPLNMSVYKQDKYIKIVVFLENRLSDVILEYYYYDTLLFFMFSKEKGYMGMKGRAGFDENTIYMKTDFISKTIK
jgi:hypothetical protein